MAPNSGQRFRVKAIFLITMAIFLWLLLRLYSIQGVNHFFYSERAKRFQKLYELLPSQRGWIFDRLGNVLALSCDTKSFSADPYLLFASRERDEAAYYLSQLLGRSEEEMKCLLEPFTKDRKKRRHVYLLRRIPDSALFNVLKNLRFKGLYFSHEQLRTYPFGSFAGQTVGFIDIDGTGKGGVERSCNRILSGTCGWGNWEKDAFRQRLYSPDCTIQPPCSGLDVHLTLDMVIQFIVEEELEKAFQEHKAETAAAVVLDPSTGEILAMASKPSFDPNQYSRYFENRDLLQGVSPGVVSRMYPPGSTLKPFIAAIAQEEGAVTLEDSFYCHNGVFNYQGRILHDVHPYQKLAFSEVIIKSSNIGIAQVGLRAGIEAIHRGLTEKFGFGQKSIWELKEEIAGKVRPAVEWSKKYTLLSVSMGQEIAVTPIQLAAAFAPLINGGYRIRPFLISRVEGRDDEVLFRREANRHRVLSPHVAGSIKEMLLRAVEEGTGKKARIKGYRVGGKTGTSQKIQRDGTKNRHVSSFAGFAPYGTPRMCVLVMIDEPKGGAYYGGTVAAPVVRNILERSLNYLGILPMGSSF